LSKSNFIGIAVFTFFSILLISTIPGMVRASQPSLFIDPFTPASEPEVAPTQANSQGSSNNCSGTNCDSLYGEYLTKQLDQLLTSKTGEICGAGEKSECNQLNNLGPVNQGNQNHVPESGSCNPELEDECIPQNNIGGNVNINSPIPEQEICGDLKDNDGNGLVDENCGFVSNDNQQSNSNSPTPVSNTNSNTQNTIPEQEVCGDLKDNDDNGLVDENCNNNPTPNSDNTPQPISDDNQNTNPPVGKDKDKFGIRMLYPTKLGGEQWYMRSDHPEKDPQFRPQVPITKNSDGSFKVKESKIRMGVWPSTGNHPEKITTYNEKELEKKGYMESPNDWRNVEITGYVKFNKGVNYDNFAWYARGGIHTDGKACEGTAYKGQLYYNGKTRFAKEQWFVSYVFSPYKQSMGSMQGKWIGFKTAMYNVEKDGHIAVKLEIWLDKSNDGNWEKVYDYIDDGGWGNDGGECGGGPDQIISWGGPLATFRWDNAFDVDIKDFSVREIQSS
jgi:hypothetical protein